MILSTSERILDLFKIGISFHPYSLNFLTAFVSYPDINLDNLGMRTCMQKEELG
jgi:hypothetical protein